MIGTAAAVAVWALIVGVIRHEGRAQRAEWAALDDFDRFREEMERQ